MKLPLLICKSFINVWKSMGPNTEGPTLWNTHQAITYNIVKTPYITINLHTSYKLFETSGPTRTRDQNLQVFKTLSKTVVADDVKCVYIVYMYQV